MSEPELFDSKPYYVPPPPVKLQVKVHISHYSGPVAIRPGTSLWEVYHTWKKTQDPEDENNLCSWLLDELSDDILSDVDEIDWEEV